MPVAGRLEGLFRSSKWTVIRPSDTRRSKWRSELNNRRYVHTRLDYMAVVAKVRTFNYFQL